MSSSHEAEFGRWRVCVLFGMHLEKQEISGERFGVLLLARDTPHVEAADLIFVPSSASRYEKERKKGEEEMDRLESQERLNRS